jgi:signal transduction histidine kinase
MHPGMPGVGRWALGYLAFILSAAIRLFDLGLSFDLQTAISNALVVVLYFLIISGVRQFSSMNARFSIEGAVSLIFLQISVVVIVLGSSYETRVALISGTISVLSTVMLAVVVRSRRARSTAGKIITVSAAINAIVASFRMFYALGLEVVVPLTFDQIDTAFMLWSILHAISVSIGLYIFAQDELHFVERTHLRPTASSNFDLVVLTAWKRLIHGYVVNELRAAVSSASHAIETHVANKSSKDENAVIAVQQDLDSASSILDEINDFVMVLEILEDPNFEPVSLRVLADELAVKWGVPVARRKANSEIEIVVDIQLFFIAMGNVISNGLRHAVSFCRVDLNVDQDWIILDVIDDGPGLPPQAMDFRIDAEESNQLPSVRLSGSLGVGLLLTQAIVAAHGGQTVIYSQKPSVVRLAFPLKANEPSESSKIQIEN